MQQPGFPDPAAMNQFPQSPAPVAAPYGPAPAAVGENPGQTLGIISIVLDVIGLAFVGMILGIISRSKSKAAGMPTTLGTIGMVLGIIFTVIGFLYFIFIMIVAFAGIQESASSAASSSGSSSFSTGSSSLDDDVAAVEKRAEAYNALAGDYPKTISDFSKHPESTVPDDISLYSAIYTSNGVTYVYCGTGAAQITYLGDSQDDKRITALGTASSTEACERQM